MPATSAVVPHPVSQATLPVLVAGGGMVGLSLALALAGTGQPVVVLEHTPFDTQLAAEFDGRVSAIALASKNLFAALDVWDAMAPHAEPILDIRVADQHSPLFLHYDHAEVGSAPFGWIIENRHTRHALVQAVARTPGITVHAPASLQSFTEEADALVAHTTAGDIRASLLIGTDGKHSRTRALAGIQVAQAEYGHTAIVCTIRCEKPHRGVALERFLPAGPFAVLPMPGNHASLVWTEAHAHAPHFLALPEAEFNQEIQERVGDWLGQVESVGPRFSYPLSVSHAYDYVAGRVALAGDAAHAIHPIAGQGVNLGFRDVGALAETIRQHGATPEALAHYQRWRRFDSATMTLVTDGLTRLFSNRSRVLKWARGLGMWGVAHTPPLKRFFMRDAMGLTGDVPPLMRAG